MTQQTKYKVELTRAQIALLAAGCSAGMMQDDISTALKNDFRDFSRKLGALYDEIAAAEKAGKQAQLARIKEKAKQEHEAFSAEWGYY